MYIRINETKKRFKEKSNVNTRRKDKDGKGIQKRNKWRKPFRRKEMGEGYKEEKTLRTDQMR